MVKKDLKLGMIWELLSLFPGILLRRKQLKISPDKCPLSGVTSGPPTVSIRFSESRMFFSTWSALACMRVMSMAKSLAWVLRESTDRHQRNFNIQQSRRAVLCVHDTVVLLCGRHRQLILGWDCLGLADFFHFFSTKGALADKTFATTSACGSAKGGRWQQEQEVSLRLLNLFDLYSTRTSYLSLRLKLP